MCTNPIIVPALIMAALFFIRLGMPSDDEKEAFSLDVLVFLLSCLFGGSDTD
jgi:hypothetical protein